MDRLTFDSIEKKTHPHYKDYLEGVYDDERDIYDLWSRHNSRYNSRYYINIYTICRASDACRRGMNLDTGE